MVEVDKIELNAGAKYLYDMYRPEEEQARKNWLMYCHSYGDFSELFNIKARKVVSGYAEYELTITKEMMNRLGLVYGGLVFNLADLTAGGANISAGGYGPTVSGTIDYIGKSALTETLICKAKLNKKGKSISFCESYVYNGQDALVAKCSFIFSRAQDVQ